MGHAGRSADRRTFRWIRGLALDSSNEPTLRDRNLAGHEIRAHVGDAPPGFRTHSVEYFCLERNSASTSDEVRDMGNKTSIDFLPSEVTPKSVYINGRNFPAGLPAAFLGAREFLSPSWHVQAAAGLGNLVKSRLSTSEKATSMKDVTTYNFYEFGTSKDQPAQLARNFKTSPWALPVEREVAKARNYTMDEILKVAPRNIRNAHEYGFYSNVNPQVDHPRWNQATECRLGEVRRRPTLMLNGYADQVVHLYAGMDLKKDF